MTDKNSTSGQVSSQVGGHVSGHVEEKILENITLEALLDFCKTPRTRTEMQEYCGIKSRDYFTNKYIKPLLKMANETDIGLSLILLISLFIITGGESLSINDNESMTIRYALRSYLTDAFVELKRLKP